MNKAEQRDRLVMSLTNLGFEFSEIQALIRIERTLQRWSEQECGNSNDHCSWAIERDEITNIPYRVVYPHSSGEAQRTKINDREGSALKRLEKIMTNHPGLVSYHQTDPRGCALYIVTNPTPYKPNDPALREWLSRNYNQGLAVAA